MVRFAMVRERGMVEYGSGDAEGPGDHESLREPSPSTEPNPSSDSSPASVPDPSSKPNPFAEPDALEDLGDEIATIAARIHQATHRLLVLLADFDRRRGWELGGHRSAAHWLSFRTGIDLGAARERVRAARALVRLPEIGAAMAHGALSFSQVRALTRAATAENESELLEFALGSTTASLERLIRGWKKRSRKDEAEWERMLHESRTLSVFPDDEGMYVIRGRLTAEVGALLMRAIEAAGDALFRENGGVPEELRGDEESTREAARRRADAIGLLAERALGVGFGESADKAEQGAGGDVTISEGHAPIGDSEFLNSNGRVRPADSTAPISGTRAERYQVVLHVDPATLSADGEPGRSELEDGVRVAAETSRRVCCDASVVRAEHAPDGSILSVGRRTRTISPALRRALDIRDRGCRFPGCGLRFTDGHHVRHWADGGETSLGNCLLLCRHHHRLVHEGGWRVEWWGRGRPVFHDPRGGMHFDGRYAGMRDADAAAERVTEQEEAADDLALGGRAEPAPPPGPLTASARWRHDVDIPDAVRLRAIEAMIEEGDGEEA